MQAVADALSLLANIVMAWNSTRRRPHETASNSALNRRQRGQARQAIRRLDCDVRRSTASACGSDALGDIRDASAPFNFG
jgi:hypothetical protein